MDYLSTPVATIAVACIATSVLLAVLKKNSGHPPLPPGPKGLPIVGNVKDLPKRGSNLAHHWLTFKHRYGPISSITVMGKTIIIINSADVAFELLEGRSRKYSSRTGREFSSNMVGWEHALALTPYNQRFRTLRKDMGRVIGSKSGVSQFHSLQEAEVGHFLLHVLEQPESLFNHIRRETGSIILRISYGYKAESHRDDLLIDIIGDAMDKLSRSAVLGAYLVDTFPFLKYLPEWFPGAEFKKTARQWRAELNRVTDLPYAFVKHQMAQNEHEVSYLSRLVEAGEPDSEKSFTNKWSAMSLYAAGADTTVAAMKVFFLAMALYPEVLRKAQEELDRVILRPLDRLPTMSDRDSLPYIEAVVQEILRWQPVAVTGVPHTTTEDDIYEGYFIPKGSTILPNIWYFTRNPEVYTDPETFKPERFLGPEPETHPAKFVFGFGRRICPGRVLADHSLFLNVAQVLTVFNIEKPIRDGKEIAPKLEFEPGLITHPRPFEVVVKPRSQHHEQIIRNIEKKYPWEESDSAVLERMEY
ncbi:putative cytochrome P450 oxidoreductase OrdA-like protein [Xylariales sp. PMI_506]|nr:putative cytochrome P450 oxidoreductase OrdA-like protein [Xylariales sp. PMI_506]